MIVTKTPLRISFAGGGTDFPDFFRKQDGAVLSTAINKHIYVTVKRQHRLFNENYRLSYSQTEHAECLDDLKNDIARECIRMLEIEPPLYVSTVADLPAFSGLGSSSSFAVGLLHALHTLRGDSVATGQLASEAAKVEIEILKRPIGKQDHYAAAYGGLNYFRFLTNENVSIEPQALPRSEVDLMFAHFLLFWTGIGRSSQEVLREQVQRTGENTEKLLVMRSQAENLCSLLRARFDLKAFARELDAGWRLKRELASGITDARINEWYEKGKNAGALGGKLCGAGGGGFLLFIVEHECRGSVIKALSDLTEIDVNYEPRGTKLLF